MILNLKNIGQYVMETNLEKSTVDGMITKINSNDMKYILEIDISEDMVKYKILDYTKDVVSDALFYQVRNGILGGGLRLDSYNPKEHEKIGKKVEKICDFCEIRDRYLEVKKIISDYLDNHDKNTFVMLKVNGKTPKELFAHKFLNKMYSTMYTAVKGKHKCHFCEEEGQTYNTVSYSFYTNDKGVYKNVEGEGKSGILTCKRCLDQIILGKEYAEQNLTAYWLGKQVMFLPRTYNECVAEIYEKAAIHEEKKTAKLIELLRLSEEDFIDELGKTQAITDIVFYEENTTFKVIDIHYVIQSIMPSRFSFLGTLFKKYGLRLYLVIRYTTALKVSLDTVGTTDKERIRIIDSVFTAKKMDRSLFFKRCMDIYKFHYLKNEHKKYACIKTINKIYSFLCECGCLEKGWGILGSYKNYHELFEDKSSYFDLNEKKAWFILGRAYSKMIYYMQPKNSREENKEERDKTSLEKTFFFARKFDYNDFIYFCNLLTDKAVKYNISVINFKKMICEAKELMASRERRLLLDEAKYLFFWGMDAYFGTEKQNEDTNATDEMKEDE